MRIEVRGRKLQVTEELHDHVRKRFQRVGGGGRLAPDGPTLDVELSEERNPAISDRMVAEATLHLKGVTLRAREASPEMLHSIHALAEDIRRQVKRHREKRRGRSQTRRMRDRLRRRTA